MRTVLILIALLTLIPLVATASVDLNLGSYPAIDDAEIRQLRFADEIARDPTFEAIPAKLSASSLKAPEPPAPIDGDENWWAGFCYPGTNGYVNTLVEYDGNLIAGGGFTEAGGLSANYIAAWNELSWEALGDGTNFRIYAMTVYQGDLVVGGQFTQAGNDTAFYIARWNGTSWSSIGGGMNDWVYALTVYDGDLIAGGYFTRAGGLSARSVARWNGATWSPVGDGFDGPVFTFQEYAGGLFAGGWFEQCGPDMVMNIARWDGMSWSAMGSGTNDRVTCMAVYRDILYIGGHFTQAGPDAAGYIANWAYSGWQNASRDTRVNDWVYALHAVGDTLYAGGWFTETDDGEADHIAGWHGNWHSLDGGTNEWIRAIVQYGGDLAIAGWFTKPGGIPASYVASWDLSSWRGLGAGLLAPVTASIVHDGRLIVGSDCIVGWDGSTWTPIGPAQGDSGSLRIWALEDFAVYDGNLVAGGMFTLLPDTGQFMVAEWNDTLWSPVGEGLPRGPSSNHWVYALEVYDGELFAGGDFYGAPADSASSAALLARWDGVGWYSMGVSWGYIQALDVFDSELMVAGNFGLPDFWGPVAGWNGDTWGQLGDGFTGNPFFSLAVFHNTLVAGGVVPMLGYTEHVVRWDGFSWSPMGLSQSGPNDDVLSLVAHEDRLIAAGDFTEADGKPCLRIAEWDGVSWGPLGSGVDSRVQELAVYDGDLYVGGHFHSAGNKPSHHIARWQDLLSGAAIEVPARRGLKLVSSSPNPFSGTARLSYSLPESCPVVLAIHDVRGRLVKTLQQEFSEAGPHSATWDGTDRSGTQVAPGVYFARLQAGNEAKTCRMVLVR